MSERAYTVGHRVSYDQAIAAGYARKAGAHPARAHREDDEDYPGGCVWRTAEEAQSYLDANPEPTWAVYELELPNGWGEDVGEYNPAGYHHLKNDSRIGRRVEGKR